jgi:multiple sugar transport system permease protein
VISNSPKSKEPRFRLAPAWWGVIPSLLALTLFIAYPLVQVFQISAQKYSIVYEGFAGLSNYARMLADPNVGRSLLLTLIFGLCTLPLFVGLATLCAIELEGTRLERLVKAILFLPSLWTIGASAIGWYTLYEPDYGMLATLTGGFLRLPWHDKGWAGVALIVLFTIWQNVGYGTLIVSAGLKSIPTEVFEAARVDGATENQLRFRIVLPLLRPSIVFLAVVGSLYAIQSYTAVLLLTQGGPFGSTRVVGYLIYETAFGTAPNLGYGAALSVLILALAFTFSAFQARALKSDL